MSLVKRSRDALTNANTRVVNKGLALVGHGSSELIKAMGLNAMLFNRLIEGGAIPALQSIVTINADVSVALFEALRERRPLSGYAAKVGAKARSALRYRKLVNTFGKQLFGSARFPGETVIAEDDVFRLYYLPPIGRHPRPSDAALFHVGGFLPFSDRIFRFLPEANFFSPILARGVPVYLMQTKGDRRQLRNAGRMTLEQMIDAIDALSDKAFEHHGGKMILEGYCGLGMPALCFAAAKPQAAQAKFKVATTMVAPIDGTKCTTLHETLATTPQNLLLASQYLSELVGSGFLSGHTIRFGIDVPFNAYFYKTGWGRFVTGWNASSYANVKTVDDLTPLQRRELAGSYWISPENSDRYAMPGDIARFFRAIYQEGIADGHLIPATYKGRQLSLRTIRDQTSLQIIGFYGGKDLVILQTTAEPLQQTMGQRYTHVLHPKAGHISYVMAPECWEPSFKFAFKPNPLDVMLAAFSGQG